MTRPGLDPRLLSVATVAIGLGVSEKTIRRLVHDGRLPSHRIGRQIRISEADLASFLMRSRIARLSIRLFTIGHGTACAATTAMAAAMKPNRI
jgi:excisionase family DNA binding protein